MASINPSSSSPSGEGAPIALMQEFLSALQSGNHETALELSSQILEKEPNNKLVLASRPLLEQKIRQDKEAEEEESEEEEEEEDDEEDDDDDEEDEEESDDDEDAPAASSSAAPSSLSASSRL